MKKSNQKQTRKLAHTLEGLLIEAVASGLVPYDSLEYAIRRRLAVASSPRNGQKESRLARLERQRRNLLFLLCRVLYEAPDYRLRPSELTDEKVGTLSCLSKEELAILRFRMKPEIPTKPPMKREIHLYL